MTVLIENPQLMVVGAPIALGANATMTVLAADGAPLPNVNANSVVVRLQLGARSVLLMGDAEAGGAAGSGPRPGSAVDRGAPAFVLHE